MAIQSRGFAGDVVGEGVEPFSDLNAGSARDFVERDGQTYLVAGLSGSSGVEIFPRRPVCPKTGARDVEPILIGPSGTLYTYTKVHVSAACDAPYDLGYVDFPSGLRVLAQVRGGSGGYACDIPVRLASDENGWWVEAVAAS